MGRNDHGSILLVVMPSYGDLSSAAEILESIRGLAPEGVNVNGVVIDESLGRDPGREGLSGSDRVITLGYRMGAQSALTAGLKEVLPVCRSAWICTMDSDGEDRPSDVWRLWEAATQVSDIVIASRRRRHSSLPFKVGYVGFKVLFRVLAGTTVQSGNFAVVKGDWLKANIERPEFLLSYAGSLAMLPAERTYVPCDRGKRIRGRSRMRLTDSVGDGLRLLLPYSGKIAARSLVALISAISFALLSLVWILAFNASGHASPGWTTSALTLVGGGLGVILVSFLVSSMMYAIILLNGNTVSGAHRHRSQDTHL